MLKRFAFFLLPALVPIPVLAIEMTDYIDPDIFYENASVRATLNLGNGNQDQMSFDGLVEGDYDMRYSTKPFVLQSRLRDARLKFDRGETDGSSTEKAYDIGWDGIFKKYLSDNTHGLYGYGNTSVDLFRPRGVDDDSYTVGVSAGAGYGRVNPATPLAQALRLIEELRRYGILTAKELKNGTYLELATIINREEEFKDKYGREDYRQYWIEEMGKALQRDGLLKNNTLGVTGTIQLYDVLFDETVQERAHGWEARAGVGYSFYDMAGRGKSESDPEIEAVFEYALPIGLAVQLLEEASYSILLETDPTHQFENRLSVSYEITDRIDWINEWDLSMALPTADNAKDTITNVLESRFNYHLTNLMNAFVRVSFTSIEDDIDNDNDDVETAVSMGLEYFLK